MDKVLATPGKTQPQAFGALRHRNFRLFLTGQIISLSGTWMQTVAQGWLVLLLTNSPFYVGLVSALGSLGVLVFSLYAGVVADRTDKRRAILITQALQMLQALALAALVWTDTVTVGSVMALAGFLGVVSAFDIPIRQSFVIDMVGKDDLLNAIALNSSVFNATRILGPAVAGIVIGKVGLVWCFVLNGVSYLAVIRNLAAMTLPPRPPTASSDSTWAGLREIMAFVRGDARVMALIVLTGVLSVFGFPFLIMMPVFARDVLQTGAEGYGALMASVGLGAMLGALGIAAFSQRVARGGDPGGEGVPVLQGGVQARLEVVDRARPHGGQQRGAAAHQIPVPHGQRKHHQGRPGDPEPHDVQGVEPRFDQRLAPLQGLW